MSHLPATNLDCEREFAQLKRIDPHTHARHLSLLTAVSLVDSEDTACSTATAGGAQPRRATCKVRRLQRQQLRASRRSNIFCRSSASSAKSRGEQKDSTVGTEAKVVMEEGLKRGNMSCSTSHTHSSDAKFANCGNKVTSIGKAGTSLTSARSGSPSSVGAKSGNDG